MGPIAKATYRWSVAFFPIFLGQNTMSNYFSVTIFGFIRAVLQTLLSIFDVLVSFERRHGYSEIQRLRGHGGA
jgi:hypothetical protein